MRRSGPGELGIIQHGIFRRHVRQLHPPQPLERVVDRQRLPRRIIDHGTPWRLLERIIELPLEHVPLALEPGVRVTCAVVADGEHGCELHPCLVQHRPSAADCEQFTTVRMTDAPALVDDSFPAQHGARQRELGARIRLAVFGEQMKCVRVPLDTDAKRLDPVHARRGGVDVDEVPLCICDNDTLAHLRERGEKGAVGVRHWSRLRGISADGHSGLPTTNGPSRYRQPRRPLAEGTATDRCRTWTSETRSKPAALVRRPVRC